ncbi:Fc.00g074860.m01.CDS01 [Cosmosporella sp. VM-42]
MRSSLSIAALALASSVFAEDVLVSKRLSKRFVDDNGNYNLSFFHVNDVHAHLDEYSSSGTDCTDPAKGCYGGYARIKHKVDELRDSHPDNLWLNAGDEFQGTLFYSFYGGEKIAETINQLGFDAMTLGNHEWDGGDEKLGEFLMNLTFPIVSCNVKSEYEGLNKTIKNYHIFKEHDLAVIGVTTDTTPSISSVGNKTTFLDPITEVQRSVWEIRNTTDIKRIVALTHIGYDIDQKLAAETEGLSLIVGGHSHTLLGDMEDAEGKYPTIVEDLNGDEVFIVTAYRWGEYLGYIDVAFDDDGKAVEYHGGPIHMDNKTAQDKDLQKQIKAWRGPFEEFAAEKVGETKVELDQTQCQKGDCLLGQVMADAMYEYRLNQTKDDDKKPDFALINSGGVRATIDEGDITRGEVLTSFPFGNAVVELVFSGSELRTILEGCVSRFNQNNKKAITSWFQVSTGIKIEYNANNNNGSKLVNVKVAGEDLDNDQEYRIVTLDFLAGGGDNIFETTTDFISLDTQDEVLVAYVKEHSPLDVKLEERIVATNETTSDDSSDDENSESGDGGGEESNDDNGGTNDANIAKAPVFAGLVAVTVALVMM